MEHIDSDSFTHLLSCLPSGHGPLVPNIRKLRWSGIAADSGPFPLQVLPFLSSSLRSLRIGSDDEEALPTTLLRMIRGITGRPDLALSHLHLGRLYYDEDHDLQSAIGALLVAQSGLQSVALHNFEVGPIAFGILSLPGLRELDVAMMRLSAEELETFLGNLASRCLSLETLHLLIYPTIDSEPPFSFEVISPLLQARKLSKVTIRSAFGHSVPLQEAEIVAMGRAWPYLESLNVSGTIPISLLSLYAYNHPKLVSLDAQLTFPGDDPVFDASTPTFRSLRNLHLSGDPPKDRLLDIGAYLSWVCIPATSIKWSSKHWGAIEKAVQLGRGLQDATATRLEGRQLEMST